MKRYASRINTGILFVILQLLLYVVFLILDITGGSIALSNSIKFSIIILCFCYALVDTKSADKSIIFFLKTALFFTLLSDLLILILDYYFYGVLSFIIVQQLYNFFLAGYSANIKKRYGSNHLRTFTLRFLSEIALATAICFLLHQLGITLEGLLIASVIYFISIVTNVFFAIRTAVKRSKDKGFLLFAIGMGLFLLCDINVGLFNLSGFITLPDSVYQSIYSASSILMWTFYAPSQVLIALSTHNFKSK